VTKATFRKQRRQYEQQEQQHEQQQQEQQQEQQQHRPHLLIVAYAGPGCFVNFQLLLIG